jgi:hypothetical protein
MSGLITPSVQPQRDILGCAREIVFVIIFIVIVEDIREADEHKMAA